MITEKTIPLTSMTTPGVCDRRLFPTLCWGSILGGSVAAIGIHFLLSALGVGAGLATFTPTDDADPVANVSIGAAIVWSVCALIALSFGGLIAGRFSHSLQSGFVHGVLVWSVTMIITVLLLSMGTGMVLGGAVKILGQGLGIGAKTVAATTGSVAEEGMKRGADQLESFIEEGVKSGPTNAAPKDLIRAKREIGFAVSRLFTPGNDPTSQTNRQAVISALTSYAGLSETDANKTLTEWTSSYQALKAELEDAKTKAEKKAKEAAERAASNLSHAAIWSFFALLVGLLVTALSGSCGAKRALLHAGER